MNIRWFPSGFTSELMGLTGGGTIMMMNSICGPRPRPNGFKGKGSNQVSKVRGPRWWCRLR
uniref:Uncharacterized protein n=1 Tax=Picea glauca TaxID=3330 RepID=A0A124GP29_PICGL|nr:hypothetical protein ABT39_MTgene521 [Picea glauca]QHR89425.1 hypothetical protein Q903MT_gene3446 [Picea sitchensis]